MAALAANQFFAIPDDLSGERWIDHADADQRNTNRRKFMLRVHGMPNGDAPKYDSFFTMFAAKLSAYQVAHIPARRRLMTTPDHFFDLIGQLKDIHQDGTLLDLWENPRLELLVMKIMESPSFQNPGPEWPGPPSRQMIEYSLLLAIWAWLQIALQKKVRGGVVRIFEEAGQIIHPWNKYDSVWVTMSDDLPYSPAAVLRKEYHEFSLRLNFRELNETKRISFKRTSNLLEHLRVMKDSPERYSIVVYIFHNRPILYALFNGNNETTNWYKDLAQETLQTLVLLAPYDLEGGVSAFQHNLGYDPEDIDLLEPMEDQPEPDNGIVEVEPAEPEAAVDDQFGASIYISRSLHMYPNWGARLLELEDVIKGLSPSTFNEWHDKEREERVAFLTFLAFLLSVILLVLTVATFVYGFKADKEAEKANTYASIGSVVADSSGSMVSSFLAGCGVPYCTHLLGENNLTMTTLGPTTTAILTVTTTAFTTAPTETITKSITINSTVP